MPKIYVDANPSTVAYVVDGGGSGYQDLPAGYTSVEAEYLAVQYGLSEFFLKWNKEIDARDSDVDNEKGGFAKVSSPSEQTPRPLPPPILILSDNETVVKQLSREYHISKPSLRKLAQQVWRMTENLQVRFEWIPRADNKAGYMLK